MSRRDKILGVIMDSVVDLTYYDRKEDEELERGEIEDAVKKGEITIDDMVEQFRESLTETLSNP